MPLPTVGRLIVSPTSPEFCACRERRIARTRRIQSRSQSRAKPTDATIQATSWNSSKPTACPTPKSRSAHQEWKEKVADKPLSVNPNATVPEDLLNRHLAADPRFKKTGCASARTSKTSPSPDTTWPSPILASETGIYRTTGHRPDDSPPENSRQATTNAPRLLQRTISKASKRNENPPPPNPLRFPLRSLVIHCHKRGQTLRPRGHSCVNRSQTPSAFACSES